MKGSLLTWYSDLEIYSCLLGTNLGHIKFLCKRIHPRHIANVMVCHVKSGHLSIVKYFYPKMFPYTYTKIALDWACEIGHLSLIKFFIFKRALISEDSLYLSSTNGHYSVVKFLLLHKDYNKEEKFKALYCASGHGHLRVVKLLIDNGAEITDLVLDKARISGNIELLRFFVSAGYKMSMD